MSEPERSTARQHDLRGKAGENVDSWSERWLGWGSKNDSRGFHSLEVLSLWKEFTAMH